MTRTISPRLSLVARGLLALACLGFIGCFKSSPSTPGTSTGTTPADPSASETGEPSTPADQQRQYWEDYPDVPYVPIMTEIDGIEIPRQESNEQDTQLEGAVPVDVGNTHAKQNPSEPVTGGKLTVRFNSEPKSLNPIIESSAVQTYIGQYVQETLAWQDPETFEYGPHIASRWEIEDSVKLASDFPGKERQVVLLGTTTVASDDAAPAPPADAEGEPAAEVEFDFPATEDEKTASPIVWLRIVDADGNAVPDCWAGIQPEKSGDEAADLIHVSSNDEGLLKISGLDAGTYRVSAGAEIYGVVEETEDGLTVTPKTAENPLTDELKSSEQTSLALEAGQWQNVQYQTVFTYYLRDDVTWSDGEPFTSRDLEFGYAVINNINVDCDPIRIYYQDLVECRGLGDYVVRMQYRQQYFKAFEFTMALSAISPPFHQFAGWLQEEGKELTLEKPAADDGAKGAKISAHGQVFGKFFNTDNRYNEAPLGTGPYTVGKWMRSDRVEINRHADYWLDDKAGHLDKIIFKFIPDNITALQALKSGEIDFHYRMGPEQFFEDLKGPPNWFTGRYVKAEWYTPSMSYYGWNLRRPLFQDRRVRVALSLLFDKQDFLEKKLHGAGSVVSGSQYYFGPAYDHEIAPIGYDPQVARELLADAGWVDTDNDGVLDKDGEKFEFTLTFPPGNPSVDERAAILQKNYKSAGITMNIRNYEWASFIDKVRAKDFDVINLSWAMSLESDPYQIWHSSGAAPESRGSNAISFADPLADELINIIRLTLDDEKRKRAYFSFHRLLDREQPYMFLYVSKEFGAYHQRFRGVKWYALRPGFDFREWYVPKDEQLP